jgi:hypothetical protein
VSFIGRTVGNYWGQTGAHPCTFARGAVALVVREGGTSWSDSPQSGAAAGGFSRGGWGEARGGGAGRGLPRRGCWWCRARLASIGFGALRARKAQESRREAAGCVIVMGCTEGGGR